MRTIERNWMRFVVAVALAALAGAAVSHRARGSDPDPALHLGDGRFSVEATWTKPDGSSGAAHPVPLTSDSGYFWFFDPDNAELIVKVLNGCSVNQRYWFFSGGLTNVEVSITVTDTTTGEAKTYASAQGVPFAPIADTSALGNCSEDASLAAHPEEPAPGTYSEAPIYRPLETRRVLDEGCVSSDMVLCLHGRFQVEGTWQTESGAVGPAHAVALSAESGYLWFFDPSNVEVMVKALNACSIEQGNWFFGAGMTNVGVALTVTDTFTGEVRNYANPVGTGFLPIQDTNAFAFCPTPTPTATPTSTQGPFPTYTPTPTLTVRPTAIPTRPTRTPTLVPGSVSVQFTDLGPKCRQFCSWFSFTPDPIHVHVGDTVTWTWSSGTHSSTSGTHSFLRGKPDGLWDSGLHTGPFTFRHKFTTAGTFPYFCSEAHLHYGGSVVVAP